MNSQESRKELRPIEFQGNRERAQIHWTPRQSHPLNFQERVVRSIEFLKKSDDSDNSLPYSSSSELLQGTGLCLISTKMVFVVVVMPVRCQMSKDTSLQAVGSGISKHTWAASDPRACYDSLKKFLPVRSLQLPSSPASEWQQSQGGVRELRGWSVWVRHTGTPGTWRLHWCPSKVNYLLHKVPVKVFVSSLHVRVGPWGFGLHTVNCSFHPYGELSLADVETIFQVSGTLSHLVCWSLNIKPDICHTSHYLIPPSIKLWSQEKFGDWSQLDGFMEYNLGLWTHDLTPIARWNKLETLQLLI